jgi:Rrf2 family protein
MRITHAADNALRVMIHLASLPTGARVNRDALAQVADVPPQFLSKVLQALARHRLILSYRGAVGGFELARSSEFITVLDVVEAVDGRIALNRCSVPGGCNRVGWCAAHGDWNRAQEALETVLRSASIATLARESTENLSAVKARTRTERSWN